MQILGKRSGPIMRLQVEQTWHRDSHRHAGSAVLLRHAKPQRMPPPDLPASVRPLRCPAGVRRMELREQRMPGVIVEADL